MKRLLVAALLLIGVSLSAQPLPATASGSLASTASVTLGVTSYASVAFQVTGTWAGTITFEGSIDGTNYQAINVTPTNSSSAATTTTANGVWTGSVGGLRSARARMSAYTSGTAVITIQAAASGGGSGGGGGGGSGPSGTIGAAVPSTASPVAVKDNAGNLAYPLLDGSGNLLVAVTGAGSGGTSSVDGATYTAGTTAGTPAMVARDDTSPTQLAEDKVGIPRGTAFRAMHVNFRNASGTEIGVAGSAIIVDGSAVTQPVSLASVPSHNVTNAGTFAVQVSSAPTTAVTGTFWQATQPVSGTFWQATQPVSGTFWQATQPVSLASVPSHDVTNAGTFAVQASGTVTANMGTVTADPFGANADAASATGSISAKLRFIASTGIPITGTVTVGSHAVTNAGTFATQSAITAASGSIASGAIANGAVASGAYGSDSGSFGVGSTGSAPPAKGAFEAGIGSGATGGLLVGMTVCDTPIPVSITSGTTTLLITGVASRHIYICHLNLVTAIANNVAIITGTGATCGTSTAGVFGGTTAANGWNFAANGGIALGTGIGIVGRTETTGDSICAITSSAGPLAGSITYAIY